MPCPSNVPDSLSLPSSSRGTPNYFAVKVSLKCHILYPPGWEWKEIRHPGPKQAAPEMTKPDPPHRGTGPSWSPVAPH